MENGDDARLTSAVRGDFIAEWFGHRVWPFVDDTSEAEHNQRAQRCPFLSNATQEERKCVKMARDGTGPTGVCTISSDSNGVRQDWLACPYRILDQRFTLLEEPVRTLFRVGDNEDTLILPVTALHQPQQRALVLTALESSSTRVFLFSTGKLGGEVDVPETAASPGVKVDVSIVEVLALNPFTGEPWEFGEHMMYEIQTADFHGSPLHAVRKLRDLISTAGDGPYHARLTADIDNISGAKVEGPNKSNIFKRTIYQMILKMEMAEHPECAGFSIVLPVPVWQSWLRHLGNPELAPHEVVGLFRPGEGTNSTTSHSWIFVFDIDRDSRESPQPLKIVKRVATSPEALRYYAFDLAVQKSFSANVIARYRTALRERVSTNWWS